MATTATTRRLGVAIDFSPCSNKALQWALDNVVRDGDHLILVVVRPDRDFYEHGELQLWGATGSPLIPLVEFSNPTIMKRYAFTPDAATMDIVNTASKQKKVEILMKVFWGDPREKICESIDNIPLDHLVLGNRGLGTIQRAIMGSVSNYVVNNATCPVTVVKIPDQH